MSRVAHVWPEPLRRAGDAQEVAATVEWPPFWPRLWKDRRQRVWIRVPADVPIADPAVGDALLLGTVFGAMRRARALHVHAAVSEDLVGNLARLQALWAERRPDKYHVAELRCDAAAPAPRGEAAATAGAPSTQLGASGPTGPAILCFSGGLDSAYSLHRLTRPDRRADERTLGAAVMLAGADIPVGETDAFAAAFERSRRMTESRGVPLLAASTNLRIVKQNWSHSFTATLAAVLGLFRARYACGLLAIAFTVAEALEWGPQEVTDPPLESSLGFPVFGDGYERDRFQKFDAIRGWPEARENLRVCFRPGVWDRNCGECVKCLTLMFFSRIACGHALPCMPRDVITQDALTMARCGDRNVVLRMSQVVRYARARGVREPWLAVVDDELRKAGVVLPDEAA